MLIIKCSLSKKKHPHSTLGLYRNNWFSDLYICNIDEGQVPHQLLGECTLHLYVKNQQIYSYKKFYK